MAFIKFERKASGCAGAFITAYKLGSFGVNAIGARHYELEEYISCDMFYDPEKRLIGFKFFKGDNGLQRVRHYPSSTQISAKGFLLRFALDVDNIKKRVIIPKEGMKDFLTIKVGE